ncbi:hemerythrin domain-containing protein [Mycolicibacterium goodii]|uniref:hemerythrin domain-containing protein n=1 Tax=Mycolicibacterium goodii TaxID=134601 RepID=UPI001FEF317F|nr:hemerythrin domain-containing protein [Mycolicibacterium goodii]ULN48627.1 hemerythrin domain-containing protein [Mycolicibacterium goodii]
MIDSGAPKKGELTREMEMAHGMFRREFGLAADAVRRVAAGEVARAGVVADHLRFIAALLHHHHAGEDDHIWPLLLERAAPHAERVRDVERQHRDVDAALDSVADAVAAWRRGADAVSRGALVDALETLEAVVVDHMDYEERWVVPEMERHITRSEWDRVIAAMAMAIDPKDLVLAVGMTTYEGDEEIIERTVANLPPEVGPSPRTMAQAAYAGHAEVIYGTGVPPRSTELTRSTAGSQGV